MNKEVLMIRAFDLFLTLARRILRHDYPEFADYMHDLLALELQRIRS
jgi:hypothetical protein